MKNITSLPIFDRLVDENPDISFEKEVKRYANFDELRESIIQELTRLLNTKVSCFWEEYTKSMKIPFSYGMNSESLSAAETVFDVHILESKIFKVISEYEPRLTNVNVHFVSLGVDPGHACINIDAEVIEGKNRIPLTFPITMEV